MLKVCSEEIIRIYMLYCILLWYLKFFMVMYIYKLLKKNILYCKICSLRFIYVYKVFMFVVILKISNFYFYN